MSKPIDDNLMKYDYIRHMYVLTKEGVLSELGINLETFLNSSGDANPSTLPERFLRMASDDVYNWIYMQNSNNVYQEYLLACYSPLRSDIYSMLKSQLLYLLDNGQLKLYSGSNVAKGQAMELSALRNERTIHPDINTIIHKLLPIGCSIADISARRGVPPNEYREGY